MGNKLHYYWCCQIRCYSNEIRWLNYMSSVRINSGICIGLIIYPCGQYTSISLLFNSEDIYVPINSYKTNWYLQDMSQSILQWISWLFQCHDLISAHLPSGQRFFLEELGHPSLKPGICERSNLFGSLNHFIRIIGKISLCIELNFYPIISISEQGTEI